jgi:hypothetical protein
MKRIEITPVQLPGSLKRLHELSSKIWRGAGFHTPDLFANFKWALDPTLNDWFRTADVKAWVCGVNGVDVGMIVASLADIGDEKPNLRGYFGFLEFTDNEEVFLTLMSTAKDWLYEKGASRVVGPISLPPNMGHGVMVRGDSTTATFGTKWRPNWYSKHILDGGLIAIDQSYGWSMRLQRRKSPKSKPWQPPVEGLSIRLSNLDTFMSDFKAIERLAYNQDLSNGRSFSPYEFCKYTSAGLSIGRHASSHGLWVVTAGSKIVGGLLVQADLNPTIKSMDGKRLPMGWLIWLIRSRKPKRYRISMVTLSAEFRQADTLRSLLSHVTRELSLAGAVEVEFSQIYKNDREMIAALRGLDATESKEWVLFEA